MSATEERAPAHVWPELVTNEVVGPGQSVRVERRFSTEGVHPFDEIEWELRDAFIPGKDKATFEQKGVEFPKSWSQNATNIVAQKYFRGRLESSERESSVRQMVGRVGDTITDWGWQGGYFQDEEERELFRMELTWLLVNQYFAFNSPVWFNVGFEEEPQCSACFILSIEDTMDSIQDWIRKESIIFRGGSGSGINLSRLRSSREQISKGGYSSGPVSFMRGADASAGTIKSGGKTRRAAKMVILDVDHPDVEEFIWCKAKEEQKARDLELAGYDMSLDSYDQNLLQYQNANNSVRLTDAFMAAVEADEEWHLTARTDGRAVATVPARDLLHQMAEAAHQSADPGVQYDDTINAWHTSPATGRINGSNPCSEYMHLDDSACNLASLNLMKFRREDGEFDVEAFEHAVDVMILAQEITVGYSSYPTPEIKRNARAFRELGGGYANLGALLMARGLPYDSEEGRAYASAITALMTGRAYRKSAEIAARMGPHAGYHENHEAMLQVIRKHGQWSHSHAHTDLGLNPDELNTAAQRSWREALELGEIHGYRNAQATVLAPTGTISFLMDCDTTGVEPDFSLVKSKKLVGGGDMTIVNQTVPAGLEKLAYSPSEVEGIVAFIGEHNSVVGAPFLKAKHYPVFDCAVGERSISYMGHVLMMAAVQPFISGAISKTVNLPSSATVDDVHDVFVQGWKLGLKAVAIYCDASKVAQPLSGQGVKRALPAIAAEFASNREFLAHYAGLFYERFAPDHDDAPDEHGRRHLPIWRPSYTHAVKITEAGGDEHKVFFVFGLFRDGLPGEVFIVAAKAGSALRGTLDMLGITLSEVLQRGQTIEEFVDRYLGTTYEPNGRTNNPDIVNARSMADYLARSAAFMSLSLEELDERGIMTRDVKRYKAGLLAEGIVPTTTIKVRSDGFFRECGRCGGRMVRAGSCFTCQDCGRNTGCSE